MTIGLGVQVEAHRGGNWIILSSEAKDGTADLPLVIQHPDRVEPPWARYVAGVVFEMMPGGGMIGTIRSTLPTGVGLSSSAALAIAVAVALGADPAAPRELAELCQRAEQRAARVPCGIMDQLCIASAVEDHVLRMDCGELMVEPVPFPDGIEVAIVDSQQERTLTGSPYARRRAECEMAERFIGPLRNATPSDAESLEDPILRARARHVTTENQRVEGTVMALEDGDVQTAGGLMVESHYSLREDFEVSTPRLDSLVDMLINTPGVYGARLTGAGFGGCVVALCAEGTELPVAALWRGRPAAGPFLD